MIEYVTVTTIDLSATAVARVSRRLIPFLFLLYILNFLDRVNVGFAALEMNRDLGFGPAVYGFGAGVFFLGYCLFEVPSNLVLYRTGARLWIARIMVTWGLAASAMMLVHTPWSFYAAPLPAGRGGGGLLSRHHLLSHPLVSRAGAGPGLRLVPRGDPGVRGDRRADLGRAARARRTARPAGLAVALPARGHPVGRWSVSPSCGCCRTVPGTRAGSRRWSGRGWRSGWRRSGPIESPTTARASAGRCAIRWCGGSA